jgi:hypothetical protein
MTLILLIFISSYSCKSSKEIFVSKSSSSDISSISEKSSTADIEDIDHKEQLILFSKDVKDYFKIGYKGYKKKIKIIEYNTKKLLSIIEKNFTFNSDTMNRIESFLINLETINDLYLDSIGNKNSSMDNGIRPAFLDNFNKVDLVVLIFLGMFKNGIIKNLDSIFEINDREKEYYQGLLNIEKVDFNIDDLSKNISLNFKYNKLDVEFIFDAENNVSRESILYYLYKNNLLKFNFSSDNYMNTSINKPDLKLLTEELSECFRPVYDNNIIKYPDFKPNEIIGTIKKHIKIGSDDTNKIDTFIYNLETIYDLYSHEKNLLSILVKNNFVIESILYNRIKFVKEDIELTISKSPNTLLMLSNEPMLIEVQSTKNWFPRGKRINVARSQTLNIYYLDDNNIIGICDFFRSPNSINVYVNRINGTEDFIKNTNGEYSIEDSISKEKIIIHADAADSINITFGSYNSTTINVDIDSLISTPAVIENRFVSQLDDFNVLIYLFLFKYNIIKNLSDIFEIDRNFNLYLYGFPRNTRPNISVDDLYELINKKNYYDKINIEFLFDPANGNSKESILYYLYKEKVLIFKHTHQ